MSPGQQRAEPQQTCFVQHQSGVGRHRRQPVNHHLCFLEVCVPTALQERFHQDARRKRIPDRRTRLAHLSYDGSGRLDCSVDFAKPKLLNCYVEVDYRESSCGEPRSLSRIDCHPVVGDGPKQLLDVLGDGPDEDRILAAVKSGALKTTIGAPPAVRMRGRPYPAIKDVFRHGFDEASVSGYEHYCQEQMKSASADAEKDHQALVGASAKYQADLVAADAARRTALLASLPVGQAEFLQTPLAITAENAAAGPSHNDEIIVFGHIEPGNSFATVTRHKFVTRDNWVTFWFAWYNGEPQPVSLHVSGGLLLNGSARLFAEGGFFGGGQCSLGLATWLQPLQWWLPGNQTTPSPFQFTSIHHFPAVAVDNNHWGAGQTTKTFPLTGAGGGNWESFVVPARGSAVIKMILVLNFGVDDGTIDVDFESGDFRVTCPGILLIRDA